MLSLIFFLVSAHADIPKDAPTQMAKYFANSTGEAKSMKEWVTRLDLQEKPRAEILAYLRAQKLEAAKIPVLKWHDGEPAFEIQGKRPLRIDYSDFPVRRKLSLNGRSIKINPETSFAAAVDQIRTVLSAKAYRFSVLPEAFAAEPSVTREVFGGIAYFTGISALSSCLFGKEEMGVPCAFGSDAYWIIREAHLFNITEFTCEGDRIGKFAYRPRDFNGVSSYAFQWSYDGNKTTLEKYVGPRKLCTFRMKDGKLTSRPETHYHCEGRPHGAFSIARRPLQVGDRPYAIDYLHSSLDRFEACCKSDLCKKEMAAHIKSNLPKSQQKQPPAEIVN